MPASPAPAYLDPQSRLIALLEQALRQVAAEVATNLPLQVELERPKQASHGDFACNVAMQLGKAMKRNPRELAQAVIAALPASDLLEKAEIAGPGFINLFLKPAAWQGVAAEVLAQADAYGSGNLGRGAKVQIEFVSANPTGPLHVGHGRGAAFGASLSNVLKMAGYEVQREYYVNDAGRQMDILALSTWLRYLALCGEVVPFPGNAYQGDYVSTMADGIYALHQDRYQRPTAAVMKGVAAAEEDAEAHLDALIANAKSLLGPDYAYIHGYALEEQLGDCRNDLTEFGVTFDTWFSEKTLHESGLIDRAVEQMKKHGHLYQQDGALWFRSTAFGDEKDRVVRRENGSYTYFAADIAYHINKFERGFDRVLDVWGADHHGYIPRVKGALTAAGLDADRLTVALVQFAVLYRNGQKASMSTRSGQYVTLRELRNEVGNDAARFFYVLRKSEQHLDFDLDLAKSQSNDNPVYYIQYAHARICSVLNSWGGLERDLLDADSGLLQEPRELALLKRLAEFPETINTAARELSPHVIAYYLKELAADLHGLYVACQFLVADEALKQARLLLIAATRQVLNSGLALLGVSAPEKM
ncbi:MAG: arginine--tRNA ligase [Hydrogenophilales bacterium CG17_big_fil_post_rev_8_21_14_2_50_63_12]|nr:MAG: arginine--tRNA ligase [Hydrogenophilales bacterium CG17_big_fil_post_rev_8_21_14_2_50_63_12]PIX98423.1 MAG: arginine--tRNA ligase [Hydrogenophilales bacterium CG_4_10_14_3_um_filter_63_21]PJB04901.1 MAG: arginine--tRNA ligase [Hydrogenophilales bacterium CG_4_9_14_3_um_filter_63_34]